MQNIIMDNVDYLERHYENGRWNYLTPYIRISHFATGDYGNYSVPEEITTVHDGTTYVKYLDSNNNVFWYDDENEELYNSSWELDTTTDFDTLTKDSYWFIMPTPSEMPYTLNDVDKDPFTDLIGFTHRNRVRVDVITFDCNYSYLNDDTQAYVLQVIEPEWFYCEIINPKTKVKEIHKCYASSKKVDVRLVKRDERGNLYNDYAAFQVTMVEE